MTVTGRSATSQPNIQQIPVRTPEGAAIRSALGGALMENKDPMSYKEQVATLKLLEQIEDVIATNSTSFSIAKNVDRLMTEYRREWPK